jgi:hypothetical protein
MAAAKKNLGGRPPRHPGERLTKSRTFRVRGGLDEYLQAAAAASGRSVSEEIEFQLELSRERTERLIEEWGPDVFSIADRAARSLRHIEEYTEKSWHEDERTYELFRDALLEIVANVRSLREYKRMLGTDVGAVAAILGGVSSKDEFALAKRFALMGEPAPPRRKTSTDAEPPPGGAEQSGEDKSS